MNELNNFFLGVQQVAQDAVDKAPYDRTFRGVIEEINGDGTCNVRINGRTYENIPLPNSLTDLIYPVGSVYMSINDTDPSLLFGGVWEQIKDRFLLSAGDNYTAGDIGGEATHTLTVDEIPSHNHITGISTSYSNLPPQRENSSTGWRTVAYDANNPNNYHTNSTGGSQAHNNMPPYLTVYMWQRIG